MLTFSDIAPPEFLTQTWGRTFAHLPGTRGRFRELLSWNDVNAMLQRHRLEPPRLRLVRQGVFAPKKEYLRYEGNRIPSVVPEKLSAMLRDGHTLIIDAVDDMTDGVMRIAEDFERALHESVQVNMYAGWREQQGFKRHCDTHDVIVLQVYGRKYWRIYEGGRPHPLKDDVEPNKAAPDSVVWEGMLEDGDALYIPRGWWHEASGVGEVTLHLTCGIHQRTGVSLVHWLADQLRASAEFRAPLRRFASAEEQREQYESLRRQLVAAIDDDLLARYYDHHDTRARSRGWASLPWTAEGTADSTAGAPATPPLSARVSLATPRRLSIIRDDAAIRFDANGRSWHFAPDTAPLLHILTNGPATVADLCAAASPALEAAAVQRLVSELAQQGLVNVAGEPET